MRPCPWLYSDTSQGPRPNCGELFTWEFLNSFHDKAPGLGGWGPYNAPTEGWRMNSTSKLQENVSKKENVSVKSTTKAKDKRWLGGKLYSTLTESSLGDALKTSQVALICSQAWETQNSSEDKREEIVRGDAKEVGSTDHPRLRTPCIFLPSALGNST